MKAEKIVTVVTLALLSLVATTSSRAQSMQFEDDEWHVVSPTFYLWLFQVDGDLTVKGQSRDVDMSISDVMDNMDTGLQLYLEVDKGNWGGFVEGSFLGFTEDSKVAGVKFESDLDIIIVDFGGTYRVWRTEDPDLTLYAMAGGRYWNFDLEVDGNGAAAPDGSTHNDIIDPFVGARLRWDVTEKFHLGTRFDIGGFGISDSQSDLTWQTWLLMSYDLTKRFSVLGGYRALALDYDDGNGVDERGYDLVFHGPVIGFNFDIFGWLEDRKK